MFLKTWQPGTARIPALVTLSLALLATHGFTQSPEKTPATGKTSPPASQPASGASGSADASESPKQAVATIAAGCFWCSEAVFERMEGVNDVVSGYIGGRIPNPDYHSVCTGRTGHAEAVEIYYDPNKVTYEDLLEVFFKTHDPTSRNRQGADVGTQYRSAIFFHNADEKSRAEAYIKKLNHSHEFRSRIVTTLEPATTFYPAEEYHQDYFALNPNEGYCQAVVRAHVEKFDKTFGDKIKKDAK